MIYFVLATDLNRVKIGFAKDPWSRFGKLRVDCPCEVTLLAFIEGDEAAERALHEQFSSDRERGEWFWYSNAIRDFVATLPPAAKPERGMRQADIARKLGVSQQYVSMILSGQRTPGLKRCFEIFEATGLRIGEMKKVTDEQVQALRGVFA